MRYAIIALLFAAACSTKDLATAQQPDPVVVFHVEDLSSPSGTPPSGTSLADAGSTNVADASGSTSDPHDAAMSSNPPPDDLSSTTPPPDLSVAQFCTINGQPYFPGESPDDNECEVCDPTQSATSWSSAAEGTDCDGHHFEGFCHAGACAQGCFIDNTFVAPNGVNPSNPCQVCDAIDDPYEWSDQRNGTSCSADDSMECNYGQCVSVCHGWGCF